MKQSPVNNISYQLYLHSYPSWLQTLGYSAATIEYHPITLREFFHFLESNNIHDLKKITLQHIENYSVHIQTRANVRNGGALSLSQVNRHYGVLNKFREYILKTENYVLPIEFSYLKTEKKTDYVLFTEQEIKAIYNVTDESLYGMRDRAMLSIYYGCGLRLSEGIRLEVSDILQDKKLIFIAQAKNNHQRYVPITTANLKYINEYLYNARPYLLPEKHQSSYFFVSQRGTLPQMQTIRIRLKELAKRAGINKPCGIHTLRHSIATHLLRAGMDIEYIAMFLGHRCLDSTQVYTHLLNELNA